MVLISLVALDVLLFYVFFEAMLIPMYFLIGGFGTGENRSKAAVKFLLYNLFGGLIMLAAVIGLYVVTVRNGVGTFDFRAIVDAVASGQLNIDPGVAKALFSASCSRSRSKRPVAVPSLAARRRGGGHACHRSVDDGRRR